MSRYEHIRTWRRGHFKLKLYDSNRRDEYGKHVLAYQFLHRGRVVFAGDDFHCSPCHAIDSDAAVAALLGFLSFKPGDTDPEFFENYTPEQLEFAQQEGEYLSLLAMELEGPARCS